MPPRARPPAPSSDAFHGSFDPGVTGRRTGVAPPLKVRRLSNGVEAFSDYFNSPRKDPSVSPIRSPNKTSSNPHAKRIPSRPRNDRPDLFHDIGERGRKTGISPPKNVTRDENGFEEFDNYLIKATEQTNKAIAKERRRSLRRKSINVALHARKLSIATFVDDGDDEEYDEESINLATPDSMRRKHTYSTLHGSASSSRINLEQSKSRSRLSNSADQSLRTPNDSNLIDFDAVPEGPIHSNSRNKSKIAQTMTVEEDDDAQDSGVVNEYDDGSVGSDGFNPTPPPESPDGPPGNLSHESADGQVQSPAPEFVDTEVDPPMVLEDIMEDDEEEQEFAEGPSAPADPIQHPEPKKRRKSNSHPPPVSGPRRGGRQRIPRLDHWRGEQVVYGRSTTPDGSQRVIGMLDVVRVPPDVKKSFAQCRHRRKGYTKIKSESVAPMDFGNPENDLDSETRPNGIIYSYTKNKDCERQIVCTKKMAKLDVEDQAGVPNTFKFHKLFKGTDFIAGGLLYIPVGGGKPLKPAKDNFYFFTVLEGAVSVQVHRTTFVVAPLGVFWIPRGNVYSIQNVSQRTAKLSFAQARRATGDEQDLDSEGLDEQEHSINMSPSDHNLSRSTMDQSTTSRQDLAPNGETSNEIKKSKRGRPPKNLSGHNKKLNQNQKGKKQNAKGKNSLHVEEHEEGDGEQEQEEEEEDEDEVAQTS